MDTKPHAMCALRVWTSPQGLCGLVSSLPPMTSSWSSQVTLHLYLLVIAKAQEEKGRVSFEIFPRDSPRLRKVPAVPVTPTQGDCGDPGVRDDSWPRAAFQMCRAGDPANKGLLCHMNTSRREGERERGGGGREKEGGMSVSKYLHTHTAVQLSLWCVTFYTVKRGRFQLFENTMQY